jgi:hypothetical protein
MEPRLTRAEYWLLETVVEMPVPVCFLNPERYHECNGLELMFNKPGHGLGLSQLTDTLSRLFRSGFIEAFTYDYGGGTPGFALSVNELRAALQEAGPIHITEAGPAFAPSCTYYRLTSRGGALWEAFAVPDWGRYVKEEIEEESQRVTLTSKTAWRILSVLENIESVLYEIDAGFGYSEVLGPWKATYWKTLPYGYRTRLRWQKEMVANSGDRLHQLAFAGYCQHRDGWYHWR